MKKPITNAIRIILVFFSIVVPGIGAEAQVIAEAVPTRALARGLRSRSDLNANAHASL